MNTRRILVFAPSAALDQYLMLAQKVGLTTYGVITKKGAMDAMKSVAFDYLLIDASQGDANQSQLVDVPWDILAAASESQPKIVQVVMLPANAEDGAIARVHGQGVHYAFRGPLASSDDLLKHLTSADRRRMLLKKSMDEPAAPPASAPPPPEVSVVPEVKAPAPQPQPLPPPLPEKRKRGRPKKSEANRVPVDLGERALELVRFALQNDTSLPEVVDAVELAILERAFQRHESVRQVSAALGMARSTIVGKLKQLRARRKKSRF